jgi:ABC-2 type transport system ATP-binding protein
MDPRPRSLALALTLAIPVAALALAGCSGNGAGVHGGGTIELDEVDVSSLVGGRIADLRVAEGDSVQAGDTLAVLDRGEIVAELAAQAAQAAQATAQAQELQRGYRSEDVQQARSALADAEATLVQAERDAKRANALLADSAIADAEHDRSVTTLAQARARRDGAAERLRQLQSGYRTEEVRAATEAAVAARAQHAAARSRAGELVLTAPISGVVLLKNFDRGELAGAGVPILTLGDPRALWMRTYIAAPQIESVRLGASAEVRVRRPGVPRARGRDRDARGVHAARRAHRGGAREPGVRGQDRARSHGRRAQARAPGRRHHPASDCERGAAMNSGGGDAVVRLEGLGRRFGTVVAVTQATFEIRRGEIFGILGPNGSGKTTTIRMLCGLLAPSEGRAEVAGHDVAREPDRVKASIGYMSQAFGLYRDLTVEENLRFYGGVYGLEKALDARIAWAVERMKLGEFRHRIVLPLSGGQKQRVALGCALLHEPDVLFLDEPTAGVDPGARRLFWDIIRSVAADGTTIICTTHYMDEAERFDRLAFMSRGRVTAVGTPAEVRASFGTDLSLEDIFVKLQESAP